MSVVMKFGGTSVADPDAITRLVGIVRDRAAGGAPPTIVVSALAGVTDRLVAIAQLAEIGEGEQAARDLNALVERHVKVAAAAAASSRDALVADVRREFDDLIGLVH